tara:strand:- start:17323 stop:18231 length:909 start_codon:yes stop_codon:yes gene_type:complete
MSKILITGGSGLVGQYLQKVLDGIYVSSKDYDLTSERQVSEMFKIIQPEIVIHLAAKVGGIIDNIKNPFEYYEENVLMNTYMIKHSRLNNVKKFVGALSSCVYPDTSNHYPLIESDLHLSMPNENNFGYGYAKRLLGVHINIAKKQGYNYSYIIPSNLYGEYEHGHLDRKHFIGALLQKIAIANKNEDDSIVLFGDGTPLRQFTFAEDIAKIIKLIIQYDIKENMNLSIDKNLSIHELAMIALKATNSEHLQIKYDVTKPNGQYRKDIDCSTFKNIFPNYEFISHIEGIDKTYKKIKLKYGY